MYLADAEGERMRMCDLASSVMLSRSGLTRLVDRLERDGLLVRESCASDARGAFAKLTPAGPRSSPPPAPRTWPACGRCSWTTSPRRSSTCSAPSGTACCPARAAPPRDCGC